jgi:peptidase M42 family hydrolase
MAEDVLPEGEVLQVRKTANLHTGGTIHDVTAEVHPARRGRLCGGAGARHSGDGLDFIVPTCAGPTMSSSRPTSAPAWPITSRSRPPSASSICCFPLFTDTGQWRGTILPLKASGHTFAPEIDNQPGGWDYVEFRIDARVHKLEDLLRLGVHVGDFLAIDTTPEITDTGFINSRHLDDKAGAAVLLAAIEAVRREGLELPVDCHPLFTISEEVGSGASAALHQDVAEMLTIDNGTSAPGQNSSEFGVTIAMADQSGPFDYHLTHRLIQLCQEFAIPHQRDVFKYYRSDSAAALEAGNDVRTALITFGVDASHGYERIHLDALESLARLVAVYMQGPPLFSRDRLGIGPLTGFPIQPG